MHEQHLEIVRNLRSRKKQVAPPTGMGKAELEARKDYVVYRGWLRRSYGPGPLGTKR